MSRASLYRLTSMCTAILSIAPEAFKYRIKFELDYIIINCYWLKVKHILFAAIYYLDFIHRPYVFQPQRFGGRFFPRHQVKPTVLGPVNLANLYRWT
jgi:hypothetical protein